VTHDLEAAAAIADQLLVLRRGRVVRDETQSGGFTPTTVRAAYQEAMA
jgi:ABC-type hemin transport system ATPase subunit